MRLLASCGICGKQFRPKFANPGLYCSRQCNGEATRKRREQETGVDRDWLYQKYIVEGLDCTAIAKIVERDAKSIWNWIKGYGIPTRPRGSNSKVYFKAGHTLGAGRKHAAETREKIRQARLRDGHVPYLKNGVHHLKGKRGEETPNWKGGVTPKRQAFYSTEEWKAVRLVVWRRDKHCCRRCGMHISEARNRSVLFAIHHIVSFAVEELRAEPSNLVLLCRPCHLWVHSNANTNKEYLG